MRVVRSAYPNARLVSIDSSAARAAVGVYRSVDSGRCDRHSPIDFRLRHFEEFEPYRQPIPRQESRALCRRAGRGRCSRPIPTLPRTPPSWWRWQVDELTAHVDTDAQPNAFNAAHSAAVGSVRKGYGDVEQAFTTAHAVVALDLAIGRHSGVPMETRGAIARLDSARDILELYGAAPKSRKRTATRSPRMLGRAPSSVHLHEGHVGGGFGVRGELYPEDVLVCLGALRLNRPVKWIEDRREHLIAANPLTSATFSRSRRSR